ncbi:hypothetical protein AAGR22_07085 [Erwinia sp. HDF1-3R]|uniref:hypothetical protein n=1 Tax=Erwinia sp. HDF1-3R TaxID=3141543 RepID=UPI0031F591D3
MSGSIGTNLTSQLASFMGGAASDASTLKTAGDAAVSETKSADSGTDFMSQMQAIQAQTQQDSIEKAKLDQQNSKTKGIADSEAQAASAATQVKIQY